MVIDVILLNGESELFSWSYGQVHAALPSVKSVYQKLDTIKHKKDVDFVCIWDAKLGKLHYHLLSKIFSTSGQVWHAGYDLGTQGNPEFLKYVDPVSMFNTEPQHNCTYVSWRLSLRACIMRHEVLTTLAHLNPYFFSLDMAGLEMGFRFYQKGIIILNTPEMLPYNKNLTPISPPLVEQLYFVKCSFGISWLRWCLMRYYLTKSSSLYRLQKMYRQVSNTQVPSYKVSHYPHAPAKFSSTHPSNPKISVIIPTLSRYSYLYTVLRQLETQSISPFEIIIIDQSPISQRETDLSGKFPKLPLKHIYQDIPGQCSARNTGINTSNGDFLLFIDDDDDKIPADFLEQHYATLKAYNAGVSCGVVDEKDASPLPFNFSFLRLSDVLPTNNCLIAKNMLNKSGLFDLAYDNGMRADFDLGIRLYLSGCIMILNPKIRVFHHKATSGGLRFHNMRKVTYSSSRTKLFHLHLPSVSEWYLACRHFSREQVQEMMWHRVFGTFVIKGTYIKKILRLSIAFILLPFTLWQVRLRMQQAKQMLNKFPQIPINSN
ncbi:MAG: glycosyltransferase [Fibrobacteria bacterium]|nr:glycosyltransferase [Fibrobacteria bacterium]